MHRLVDRASAERDRTRSGPAACDENVVVSRQQAIEDGLYEKWTTWIERVYDETVTLFAYRSFYRGVSDITQANKEIPPSSFFDALGAWYATTQAMGVRRQTDVGADAVSLAKVLTNMGAHPEVMTRARFLSLWGDEDHWQRRGNEQYDRYAGAGADTIAAERYGTDLDRFQETTRPIKDYVDRLVAHNDQRQLTRLPTYEELNAAIDLLEEMLNKYLVLLKATSVPSADPVHQQDWKAAFRVAWLRD
jgi:hypothetical protein